jgi:hypothetical protein
MEGYRCEEWGMHVWERGYLVRTAGIDSTVIQNDMKEQEDEEKARR